MICIEFPKENIADNGQFMVGGGHEGRPVDCEMAKLRLWSLGFHRPFGGEEIWGRFPPQQMMGVNW